MSASDRFQVPARAPGLISREVDGGYVVLDPATDQAHHLAGCPAAIWRAAGGPAPEWMSSGDVDDTVAALQDLDLLAVAADQPSRRTLLRVGVAGGAAVAIQTIALPSPAWAASANSDLPYSNTAATGNASSVAVKIPAYVNQVSFTVVGASGAGATSGGAGGDSASISGKVTLPTGRTGPVNLNVVVGGGGRSGATAGTAGTSNLGPGGAGFASGAGSGGGASAILLGTVPLVVAGGGGGGGQNDSTAGTPAAAGGAGGDAGLLNTDGSSPKIPTSTTIGTQVSRNDLGTATINANGTITLANAALLVPGDRIIFSGTNPGGLGTAVPQTVQSISGTTVTLYGISSATAASNVTTTRVTGDLGPVSFASNTVTFTDGAHGLVIGDRVIFAVVTGTPGITAATAYYVLTVPTSTTLTLSAADSGPAQSIGTGSSYAYQVSSATPDLGNASASNGSATLTFGSSHNLLTTDQVFFETSSRGTVAGQLYAITAVPSATSVTLTGFTATSGGGTGAAHKVATGTGSSFNAAITSGSATITLTGTAYLAVNDRVMFRTTVGSITTGTVYFVKTVPAAGQITIAATSGGTAITPNATNASVAVVKLPRLATGGGGSLGGMNWAANTATFPGAHNLAVGDRVVFASPPTGLTAGLPYYVKAVAATTITVSASYNGTALTGIGSSTGNTCLGTKLVDAASDLGTSTTSTGSNPDRFTLGQGALVVGDRVMVGTTGGGLTAGSIYYVITGPGIAATAGGTALTLAPNGSSVGVVTQLPAPDPGVVTFVTSSTQVTFAQVHGLAVGDRVTFTGVTATGVTSGTTYYVTSVVSTTVITLSAAPSGAVITVTTGGSASAASKLSGEVTEGGSGARSDGAYAGGGKGGTTASGGASGPSGAAAAGAGGSGGNGTPGTVGNATTHAGGAGASNAAAAKSGGGGGGGWGPGGGGQAGSTTNTTNRAGGGGGGGSSYFASSGSYIVTIDSTATGKTGGASGVNGTDGSISITAI